MKDTMNRKVHDVWDYDWAQITGNPVLVFMHTIRRTWKPRADGLYELRFRLRERHDYERDHHWKVPVFALPSDRKQQATGAFGKFAFADDPEGVTALLELVAADRKSTRLNSSHMS